MPRNFSHNIVEAAADILVSEPQDSVATLFQVSGTRLVALDLLGVAIAVNLNH